VSVSDTTDVAPASHVVSVDTIRPRI
jgi:hypothetical protein